MANIPPIQFKRSTVPGRTPSPESMAVGEIALNVADGLFFTKDSDGVVTKIAGSGTGILTVDSEGVLSGYDSEEIKQKEQLVYVIDGRKILAWDSDTDAWFELGGGSSGGGTESFYQDFGNPGGDNPTFIVTDADVNANTDPNLLKVTVNSFLLPAAAYTATKVGGNWHVTLTRSEDNHGVILGKSDIVRIGLAYSLSSTATVLGNVWEYKFETETTSEIISPKDNLTDVAFDSDYRRLRNTAFIKNTKKISGVIKGSEFNPVDKNYYWFDSDSLPFLITDSEGYKTGSYEYSIIGDSGKTAESVRKYPLQRWWRESPPQGSSYTSYWTVPSGDNIRNIHFMLIGRGGAGAAINSGGAGGGGAGGMVLCDLPDEVLRGKELKLNIPTRYSAAPMDSDWTTLRDPANPSPTTQANVTSVSWDSDQNYVYAKAGYNGRYTTNLYSIGKSDNSVGGESYSYSDVAERNGIIDFMRAGTNGARGTSVTATTGANADTCTNPFWWKGRMFQSPGGGGHGVKPPGTPGVGGKSILDGEPGFNGNGMDGGNPAATGPVGYGGGGGSGAATGATGGMGGPALVKFWWEDTDGIYYSHKPKIYSFRKTKVSTVKKLVKVQKEASIDTFKNLQSIINETTDTLVNKSTPFGNLLGIPETPPNGTLIRYFDESWRPDLEEYLVGFSDEGNYAPVVEEWGLKIGIHRDTPTDTTYTYRLYNTGAENLIVKYFENGYFDASDKTTTINNSGDSTVSAGSNTPLQSTTFESTEALGFTILGKLIVAKNDDELAGNKYKEFEYTLVWNPTEELSKLYWRRLK